ncbi:hypothetical protein PRZ48_011534 [Zasmidium cellare]|uniref:Uncharacterized protein n=1 Tax=Zasmidium cellare TaxID=395010 RepID=A0ABR0E6Y8_ZASCE|nr:hypothetical protein PRZ48_011534 [Zasmidium cellare]
MAHNARPAWAAAVLDVKATRVRHVLDQTARLRNTPAEDPTAVSVLEAIARNARALTVRHALVATAMAVMVMIAPCAQDLIALPGVQAQGVLVLPQRRHLQSLYTMKAMASMVQLLRRPLQHKAVELPPSPPRPCSNRYGTEYVYCAPATGVLTTPSSATAIATATPSSEPGNPYNPDWADVSCEYGSLTSIYNNSTQQWDDAGASAAWDAVLSSWNSASAKEQSGGFPTFVSVFFDSANTFQCEKLGQNPDTCAGRITCATHLYPVLHGILNNFFADVGAAGTIIGLQIGGFTAQFSVVNDQIVKTEEQQAAERRRFDTVLLAIDIIVAALFGIALRQISGFASGLAGNTASYGGTVVYGEISNAFTYTELSFTTQNIVYTQDALAEYSSFVIEKWTNNTQELATSIFTNPVTLGNAIDNGAFLTDFSSLDGTNETQTLVAALFANIVSEAWSGGATVGQPFIVATQYGSAELSSCSDAAAYLTNSPPLNSQIDFFNYDDDLGNSTCFMNNGYVYWLLLIKTEGNDSGGITVTFSKPTGFDALNGTAGIFGGLDINTVQQNAVNTFVANNYENNYTVGIPQSTVQDIVSLADANLETAYGLVQIPVCGALDWETIVLGDAGEQLAGDPFNMKNSTSWPCPSTCQYLAVQAGKQGEQEVDM